jgi:hypothetical protein
MAEMRGRPWHEPALIRAQHACDFLLAVLLRVTLDRLLFLAQIDQGAQQAFFGEIDGREKVMVVLGNVDIAVRWQLNHDVTGEALFALALGELHFDAVQVVRVSVRFDGLNQVLLDVRANALRELEMTGSDIGMHTAGCCISRAVRLRRLYLDADRQAGARAPTERARLRR